MNITSSDLIYRKPDIKPVLLTLLTLAGFLMIYYQTVWSMVFIWYNTETYKHGFLILPFVVYMIWIKRKNLEGITQETNPTALIGLFILGFFWLVAELASIQIVTQYALVAMLPLIVAVMLGYRMMFAMAFPLAYLFFAVPFGEILIPPLINFTADFTIWALQLSGIPVYREGALFSLPTGNWSVVEACSGLRYLIASVTLGTLYAYLTYHSLSRRLIFILLAVLVPILANGIRAYLIVMTGHLSDMTLAVGVDHLIYGWLFFGFVMFLLFWIGSFWREDIDKVQDDIQPQIKNNADGKNQASTSALITAACAVIVIGMIWPAYAVYLESERGEQEQIEFNLILPPEHNWQASEQSVSNWEPVYVGNPAKFYQDYVNEKHQKVSLYFTFYPNQREGDELISWGNFLVSEEDPVWRKIAESNVSAEINSRVLTMSQVQLKSYATQMLVWRWYMIGGSEETVTSRYMAKALLAKNRLLSGKDWGAEVIVAAPYRISPSEAKPVLEQFLADMLLEIENTVVKIDADQS